jgi:hypothetical protein
MAMKTTPATAAPAMTAVFAFLGCGVGSGVDVDVDEGGVPLLVGSGMSELSIDWPGSTSGKPGDVDVK